MKKSKGRRDSRVKASALTRLFLLLASIDVVSLPFLLLLELAERRGG